MMVHGILNVYKEKGYTSHDVVAKLRGIIGQKKIGHTGTLDPDAEGVLPVCLGKATRLCDLLTEKEKTYEAVLLLGRTTDTQDTTGETLAVSDTGHLTEEEVRRAVLSFQGTYPQVPPMYSALKVNGKKLYELAREGKTVERKPRMVTIYGIEILSADLPRVRMEVKCSKGTYIRTLCQDIGESLGCGGCMEELLRTRSGMFEIGESMKLSEISRRKEEGTLNEKILKVDRVFRNLPAVSVKSEWEKLARNGGKLPDQAVEWMIPGGSGLSDRQGQVRLYDMSGQFIALYAWEDMGKSLGIVKMFFPEKES